MFGLRLRGVRLARRVPGHFGLQVVHFPFDGRQLLVEVGQSGSTGGVEGVEEVGDALDGTSDQLDVLAC